MIKSKDLKTSYNEWVAQEFNYETIETSLVRIDTPFFDRHNDSLILYAQINQNDTITLTDGGYVIDDLESSGIYIMRSTQRKQLLKQQLLSYGVSLNADTYELFIQTRLTNFPNDKHRLLQAMLFTNDMFMLGKKITANVFFEDVATFLEKNNIRAFQNVSFIGVSGMSHKFEFSIPGIREIPDRLIKTLNVPNNEMYAKALTADVHNTAAIFSRPTQFYAFVNDTDKKIKSDIRSLLEYEDIKVIPYSQRENFVKELAL